MVQIKLRFLSHEAFRTADLFCVHDLHKIKGKTFAANAFRKNRIVLHGFFRGGIELDGFCDLLGREPAIDVGIVATEVVFGLLDGIAEEVDIFQKRLSRSTIVTVEERVDEGHFILEGIPLKMRDDPLARADEIAQPAASVTLFEQADGVVVHKEADIGGETAIIRLREKIVGEVGYIVPNKEVGGDGAPVFDVLLEANVVCASLQRLREIHFDAAEADDDVFGGFRDFRCLSCILVCKGFHEEVRILFCDVRRDGVDEAEQQAGGAAFFFFDGFAFGALAVATPVVL